MASAIYILDLQGKVLISRDYRGDTPPLLQERFVRRAIAPPDSSLSSSLPTSQDQDPYPTATSHSYTSPSSSSSSSAPPPPVFSDGPYSFVYLMHRDIYMLIAARSNANAALLLSYLHRLVDVFTQYLGRLEEESVKDNFVVLYELLDEMMDFGYPQSTEAAILQQFIKAETHRLSAAVLQRAAIDTVGALAAALRGQQQQQHDGGGGGGGGGNHMMMAGAGGVGQGGIVGSISRSITGAIASSTSSSSSSSSLLSSSSTTTIPRALTQSVGWRPEGIHYRKNECFLDVVERVNMLVSPSGATLRSDVCGALRMRCFLSGMPELKLGLNDRLLFEQLGRSAAAVARGVDLEDVKFHQCVRLNRFEADRTIAFVPPDGEFDLMSYRLATRVKPLVVVECTAELHGESRIEFLVRARTQFKRRSTAHGIQIHIPVPPDTEAPSFRASMGNAAYVPESDCIVWTIRQLPGGKECGMRAQVLLPSVTPAAEAYSAMRKRPIRVQFEIPYYTVSGLAVRFLKIVENKLRYQALPWVRYLTVAGDYVVRQSPAAAAAAAAAMVTS